MSNPDSTKSFVIFDIETTGLSPTQGHEILEIAAEKLVEKDIAAHYHALVLPKQPIPAEATAIHGLTNELVREQGRDPKEVIEEFISFIGDSILVGHNVGFDLSFVNYYAQQFGMPVLANATLDTCEIARRQLILPSYSLERVTAYFGITNNQAHRAQADVEATRKVFLKLLERATATRGAN